MKRAIATLVALVALLSAAAPAQAAFPGQNGKIAFASNRDGDYEIFVMNADGSGQTPLTANTSVDVDPAWSPDGTRIAFTRGGHIWVMNADGTGEVRLTSPAGFGGDQPAWSPDGARIAFRNRYGISVMNADGTGAHELTPSGDPCCDPDWIDGEPAWSPGGTTILFSRYDTFGGHTFIWAIRPDGTELRRVTDDITFGEGRSHDEAPNWAPGGPRFAVSRYADPEFEAAGPVGLVIASEADPEGYTLYESGGSPAWSPDGTKIAFDNGWISVISLSGGFPIDLTTSLSDRDPDWQPVPVNTYVRPKSAGFTRVSLVPAHDPCTAPDRLHGPPLAYDSCSTPRQVSDLLTVGSPDANGRPAQASGQISFAVQPGMPGTPADEADVRLTATLTDVRNAFSMTDYEGELWAKAGLRITDKDNRFYQGGAGAATLDTSLTFPVPCAATASTSIGSTCSVDTSADAVLAGSVKESIRAVWQLDRVGVYDDAGKAFMTQGVFVP